MKSKKAKKKEKKRSQHQHNKRNGNTKQLNETVSFSHAHLSLDACSFSHSKRYVRLWVHSMAQRVQIIFKKVAKKMCSLGLIKR